MQLDMLLSSLWFWVWLTCLGACIGSFLNVVIYRLPKVLHNQWHQAFISEALAKGVDIQAISYTPEPPLSLAFPRSFCPRCQQSIRWWHNVPVISYLVLRGCCAMCHVPIPKRYLLIELLGAMLPLMIVWRLGLNIPAVAFLLFSYTTLALSVLDARHYLLPDKVVLSLLWAGLLVNVNGIFVSLESAVIGSALGYGVLWLFCTVFSAVTGKQGMGQGDWKLLAAIGAWFGWQSLSGVVLVASVSGLVFALVAKVVQRRALTKPLPFGPFLALGAWLSVIMPVYSM